MPKVAKVCKAAQYEAAPLAKFDYCLTTHKFKVPMVTKVTKVSRRMVIYPAMFDHRLTKLDDA